MDEPQYVRKRPSYPGIKKEGVPGYAAVKGWTLHGPAAAGDENQCRRLIQQCAEVDVRDENGWTPLRWAVQYGKGRVIDLLLKAGADPNAKFDKSKTCLHFAAYKGSGDVCSKLLDAGAEVNAVDEDGFAPYDIVYCPKDSKDTLRQLLAQHGGKHHRMVLVREPVDK